MNKFFAAIARAPKRVAGITMIAAAILVPAALFAWGPDRPTFTYESPAPYVTFNSITNNPKVGDERNFVRIKEAGSSQNYGDNVALQAGKTYQVYMYFHNNAASNLNDAAHQYKGIAKDVALQVKTPATVAAGTTANIRGVISSSNANPGSVWDEASVTTKSDVALRYVSNSATIYSNGAVDGQKLPDTLFGNGTALGYDTLDGTLPGCNEFAGYVIYEFVADQPNFEVTKTVSKDGENKYSESVTTESNGKVQYKIQYKNTGTTQQDGVVIKDSLPAGMKYVAGSTQLASSASDGQYKAAPDGVTTLGLNIGSYAPNGNAYIKFTAQVVKNEDLAACGVNTLINKATAETQNGSKSDTANVVVTKECQPVKIQVCELSTKKIITIDEKNFDSAKHSKNLDDCKAPGTINVCDLATKTIINITEDQFDNTKHSKNLQDCVTITPPELPHTGAGSDIGSIFGLGALIASVSYYAMSRRLLGNR